MVKHERSVLIVKMGKVHLEVFPLLADSLGMENTGEEVISERKGGGYGSVRDLLNQLGTGWETVQELINNGSLVQLEYQRRRFYTRKLTTRSPIRKGRMVT